MEKRSRKKKATSLRVSLGRKSVGDGPATNETSNASVNESCHLNPDSAIIDPDVAANPEWFQHLGSNNSILVSQNSVNEAILNERDANIMHDSNVEGMNLSSFDKRQINKILNSSVVVSKSEIERHTKRTRRVLSEDADAESSEEDNQVPVKTKSKSRSSTSSTFSRKSKLLPDNDESIEIKRKRPAFLQRRKKGEVSNTTDAELFNVFKERMEQSTDSEAGTDSSKQILPSSSTKANRSNNSASEDISIQVPRRRPNFLKKSIKPVHKKSVDAYKIFSEAMDQTSDISEAEVIADGPQETSRTVVVSSSKRDSAAATVEQDSPVASDVSLDIRRRRPGFLKKKSKKDSGEYQEIFNIFEKGMEQTTDSEAASDVSNQILPSVDANKSRAKSVEDDASVEIPRRRPGFLKKGSQPSSTYHDAYAAFLNVTSGSEEEVEAAVENQLPMNKTASEQEADVSMPLGAEANNFGDVFEDIPTSRKRTLSLKKLHSGNQINLLSQVAEEDTFKATQNSQLAPNMRNSILNTPERSNISKLTNASVTEHTRAAPFRVSHVGEREHFIPEVNASPTPSEKHLSRLGRGGNASETSFPASIQLPNITLQSAASLKRIASPPSASKRQSTLENSSLPFVQDIINSPLSAREPLLQRSSLRGNSEKNVALQQSSVPQGQGSESDDAMSAISNATTVSLPSNLTSNLSGLKSQHNSKRSESTADVALTSTGSSSVFVRETLENGKNSKTSQRLHTEGDSSMNSLKTDMGSDSVFSSTVSKSRKSNLSFFANQQVKETSRESSWTENPYVDIANESIRGEPLAAESEPFEEELSPIEAVVEDAESDSSDSAEEHNSINQVVVQPNNVSIASEAGVVHPTLESHIASPLRGTKDHGKRRSIFSPLPDRIPSPQLERPQPTVARKESIAPKSTSVRAKKVHDKSYLDKMRLLMSNWTKEVHQGLHISKPLSPKAKPTVFKKPEPKPVPKVTRKKEVCPYLKDYRPPKRVKPKPYVTAKMYKFLETKLQPKFGLESRIKAEEFVLYLCETVTSVIKKKSKYHQLVFDLRDEMVELGIINTQLQYHLFIEEYLPDSYRVKSIPCYGCSKGPKLDTDDINKDLSVKKQNKRSVKL